MSRSSGAAAARAAERTADHAKDQPALAWTARLGFACYGLVYLVMGWLSLHLAIGRPDQSVSGSGAFAQLVQEPLGRVLVWVTAGGFGALVVWEICQAVGGHRDREGLKRVGGRVGSGLRGVVFGVLAFTAARTALGTGHAQGASGSQQGATARLLSHPWGPALVAAIGIGLLGFGIGSVVGGITGFWRRQIDADGRSGVPGTVITVLARSGYVARGVAFGIVGVLVAWAAIAHDPQKSGGLDQALQTLRSAPEGPYVLVAVALGLACYGAFNMAKLFFLRDV